ncbi:MAG TPA: M20/M25/M40 family metallo-hydrolase [Symbiobacteriaceae bacterium]
MINQSRILETFLTLVQTDTQTKSEGRMADLLQARLEAMGFIVQRDDAGQRIGGETGNLIARLKGTKGGMPLLLCAHMDRVSPGTGIKPQIKDGVITSDGTTILGADDAAGLAAILEGIQSALEHGIDRPDLEVVFTIAEEGGLNGSKNMDFSLITAKMGYVLDSSGPVGVVINRAPAQTKVTYRVIGKAAHGGVEPEKGINALYVAAHALTRMKLGRIDAETTANLGIAKGGTATNAVMETFEMKGDVRSLVMEKMEAQLQHMAEVFEQTAREFGARVEREEVFAYGPVNLQPGDPVLELASAAIRRIGLTPELRSTGGGSDANVLGTQGIAVCNLAVGYEGAHSVNERLPVKELERAGELVYALIQEYASR